MMKVILTRPHLDYKEGDEMEVTPDMAAYLVRVGAAKEPKAKKEPKAAKEPKAKPQETHQEDAIPDTEEN